MIAVSEWPTLCTITSSLRYYQFSSYLLCAHFCCKKAFCCKKYPVIRWFLWFYPILEHFALNSTVNQILNKEKKNWQKDACDLNYTNTSYETAILIRLSETWCNLICPTAPLTQHISSQSQHIDLYSALTQWALFICVHVRVCVCI